MGKLIDLATIRAQKISNISGYSVVDMILDPSKKKDKDDYYNHHYEYADWPFDCPPPSEEDMRIMEKLSSAGNK